MTESTEERRIITVLFADIVGYTGLVEYLDPERAKRLIDDAFRRLIADVVEYGGSVDKVLGDGILALFGAPVTHEDDPDRAIRAALQMHDSLATFVHEHDELERVVQLRVGVNTGEVLFGRVIGSDDHTVMGDVVNVASRLESLAPPGQVYIGESTANLATSNIVLEEVDNLEVRGREQSERVWRVVGLDRQAVAAAQPDATPFVGRAEQRELLASMLQMTAAGRGVVVAVSGEAGVGKTRLITEALGAAADQVAVLSGRCAPFGEANVWAPIAAALFGQLEPLALQSPSRLRTLSIEYAIAHYGFDAADPLLPRLAEGILHVSGHGSKFDDLPPTQARETLFTLIVEALRRRSAAGPVVVWIDDMQWADALLVDLLDRIARSLTDRPLLLLTAQRAESEIVWPPTTDGPVTVRMVLDPLGRTDADELVAAIIGAPVHPLLAEQLFERSGGNPLFLTELAELAGEDPDGNELPSSLRVLIAARLDRLPPTARAIIDNAAVLGRDGPLGSLRAFADAMSQPFSLADVEMLAGGGLLEIDNRHWRFRSDVVRDVAYQTLTKLARAERHAGTAAVMAAQAGAPISRTAHHAASAAELVAEIGPVSAVPADISSSAIGFLRESAQQALDVGAFNRALAHANRALELQPDDENVERALRLLKATASTERRDFEPAREEAERVLALALDAGHRRDEAVARRLIGVQAQTVGDLTRARAELDTSIAIFRQLDEDAELALSLADRGFSEIFGGSLNTADTYLDEAEDLAERLGDQRAGAWAREHKAMVAFLSGDVELATRRLEVAAAQFQELGDRSGLSWTRALSAYLAFFERRFEDAERIATEARTEALKLGDRWAPGMMDALVASIRLWSGEFTEAEQLSRQALVSFRELGDRFGLVQALAPNIRALVALGRRHEAERGLEEALSLADSFGSLAFPAMAAAGAAVHLGLGDRSVVISELALERTREMGANASEAQTTLALALCQAGRADDALGRMLDVTADSPYAHAVRALALATTKDVGSALAEAERALTDSTATYLDQVIAAVAAAAAERAQGNPDRADDRLRRARQAAEDARDAVAIDLASGAASLFGSDDDPQPPVLLGPGWQRALEHLHSAAADGLA